MSLSLNFLGKGQVLFWLTVCAINTIVCAYQPCLTENNTESCIPTSNRQQLDDEWRRNNCEEVSCVRKCCPLNMHVSDDICNASIYEKEMETELKSYGSEVIVQFLQDCGKDIKFMLEPTDKFRIDNGTFSLEGTTISASYNRYCIDWFNSSKTSMSALICFPEYVEEKYYSYAGKVIL